METENLKLTLNKLRADLASTATVDPELKDMLHLLEQDIQTKLARDERLAAQQAEQTELAERAEQEGLADRTQEISAKFAAEHPRLEPVLRELGAILQRIGI